jgi:hypothetical protein
MPRRAHTQVNTQVKAVNESQEVIRLLGPGCWLEKPGVLATLNRGRQVFECACARCAPELYCEHWNADGRRCENLKFRPRWAPQSNLCRTHGSDKQHEFKRGLAERFHMAVR